MEGPLGLKEHQREMNSKAGLAKGDTREWLHTQDNLGLFLFFTLQIDEGTQCKFPALWVLS